MEGGALRLPPDDFAQRDLPTQILRAGTELYRVTRAGRKEAPPPFRPLPEEEVPGHHRFHSPSGLYRVAYFGLSSEAAFVEAHLRGSRHPKLLPQEPDIHLLTFELKADLPVGLLADHALPVLGATTGSVTGPYAHSQAWGEATSQHPAKPSGLIYPSARASHLRCLALFDDRVEEVPENRGSQHLRLDQDPLRQWARDYRIGWSGR